MSAASEPGSATREGVRLHWHERGTGEPSILALHGWCLDHSSLEPLLERLSARHRVVAPDLRGFGASDAPPTGYRLGTWADDAAWLIERLELGRPVVLGHSLGGAIGLALAACEPAALRGLILLDAPIVLRERTRAYLAGYAAELGGADPGTAAARFAAGCVPPRDGAALRERFTAAIRACPAHVRGPAFRALLSDTDALAARCRVPALLIDSATPMADDARLRALCPGLERVAIEGAGHFLQEVAPDEVARHVDRFVAGL